MLEIEEKYVVAVGESYALETHLIDLWIGELEDGN